MIRVVVVVAATVALIGAAAPLVADARVQTTNDRIGIQGERIGAAAGDLASESTAVQDPTLAGRRTITVQVPSGFAAATVADAQLACREDAMDAEDSVDQTDTDVPESTSDAWTPGNTSDGPSSPAPEACEMVISYHTPEQPRRTVPVPGAVFAIPSEPVALSIGTTELTLRLVSGADGPVITVERA